MSLLALVTGIDGRALQERGLIRKDNSPKGVRPKLVAEFKQAGLDPSYRGPILLPLLPDLFMMMSHQAYGVSGLDAQEMTDATLAGRLEINEQVRALRGLGREWSQMRLVATGEQIGVREGRRLHGLYTVTSDDMRAGRRHADGICTVTYGIGVHALNREGDRGGFERFDVQPYDIPLRSLLSADRENLLMAGRCCSGDFLAHSSYRQTGDAAPMGEAAGICAALAADSGSSPRDVQAAEVRRRMGLVD
jgi:hypothetical protein